MADIGRNEPCPCGSGKKHKKCCLNNKKERTTSINAKFDEPTALNKIVFHPKCGRVEFYEDGQRKIPAQAKSNISYPRAKGPKILTEVQGDPADIIGIPNMNLTRFQHIIAIDTNTKTTPMGIACVMGAIHAKPFLCKHKLQVASANCGRAAFEFWNPTDAPEKIGWKIAMDSIVEQPTYKAGKEYGFIVDSELGKIESYNSRMEPIIGDFHLPPRITMMYGSSDKKNDSILNGMISLADSVSNIIHEEMAATNFEKSGDSDCPYFTDGRQWNNVPIDI